MFGMENKSYVRDMSRESESMKQRDSVLASPRTEVNR